MRARRRPSPGLILAVLLALLVLTACEARPAVRAAVPALPPLLASADTTDVARYHLGGEGSLVRLDRGPGGSPHAWWLVSVEATPTAQGAADALAFLGRRYGDGGRILRLGIRNHIDVRTMDPWQSVLLYWNPTGTSANLPGPPYTMPPHSIYARSERDGWNNFSPPEEDFAVYARSTISGVTTEALAAADSVQHRLLLGQIRSLTGLR